MVIIVVAQDHRKWIFFDVFRNGLEIEFLE